LEFENGVREGREELLLIERKEEKGEKRLLFEGFEFKLEGRNRRIREEKP